MDEDGPIGRDGGFESLPDAVGRAKRELSLAIGHGVKAVRSWVAARWLPMRLLMVGGFSWVMGQAFGWLFSWIVELGSRLASSLMGIALPATFSTQILLLFFGVYVIHSLGQTKLILGIKTKMRRMDSNSRSEVRTDGGGDDFSFQGWAIGGIFMGAVVGWSFGMDGVFVGASVGWVLGDELDRRFEAKVNAAERTRREEHIEKQ